MQPCILNAKTPERENLEIAAKFLSRFNQKDLIYIVEDTFFDIGQNWKWTTLIARESYNDKGYQTLNPKEWEDIVTAKTANSLIQTVIDFIDDHGLNKTA